MAFSLGTSGRGRWWIALGILAVALVSVVRSGRAVPQPIQFNHRKHTQDLQLACNFCHKQVETGQHAGLPDAQTCGICHRAVQGTSEEAARVTELIQQGDPLYFSKLFRLPDHAYFSHRRHVGIAELECVNCHGEIADSEEPPSEPLVPIKMQFCLDCHIKLEQSTDCVSCHR